MHGVGGRIAVREDYASSQILLAPILLEGSKSIDRIEGRGSIGIHVTGMLSKLAREIHADQNTALFIIARKNDMAIIDPVTFKFFANPAVLSGFTASVNPFQDDQLTFTHF